MKKTRGKKVKVNSRKRLSKPASLFKRFFPVFLIVAVFLNIAILFGLDNLTGNVITGQVESEILPSNPQTPSSTPESTQLPSNPQTPSGFGAASNFNFSTPLIAGIAILLVLIVIVFLIRKVKKR
ncbi:MAG: hypothetical protein AABW47_04625 [Nanoarchaeota archaeon]